MGEHSTTLAHLQVNVKCSIIDTRHDLIRINKYILLHQSMFYYMYNEKLYTFCTYIFDKVFYIQYLQCINKRNLIAAKLS